MSAVTPAYAAKNQGIEMISWTQKKTGIFAKKGISVFVTIWILGNLSACAPSESTGTEDILGNDEGSTPINENESSEYKKAIMRCYKTGGTRVVKIMGSLKCY